MTPRVWTLDLRLFRNLTLICSLYEVVLLSIVDAFVCIFASFPNPAYDPPLSPLMLSLA